MMEINIELIDIATDTEDRIEDMLRPLFEWNEDNEDIEISNIYEEEEEIRIASMGDGEDILVDEFTGSLVLDISNQVGEDEEDFGVAWLEFRELFDSLDLNLRNIYFDGDTIITFEDVRDFDVFEDIVEDWKEKWRGGKYSFSTRVFMYDDSRCILYVDPSERFTIYQVKDLLDSKMPNIKSYVKGLSR